MASAPKQCRNKGFPPTAQIRASGILAHGSYLGCLTANRGRRLAATSYQRGVAYYWRKVHERAEEIFQPSPDTFATGLCHEGVARFLSVAEGAVGDLRQQSIRKLVYRVLDHRVWIVRQVTPTGQWPIVDVDHDPTPRDLFQCRRNIILPVLPAADGPAGGPQAMPHGPFFVWCCPRCAPLVSPDGAA
jgi:hypothetical protein